jgi:hypothetical protein
MGLARNGLSIKEMPRCNALEGVQPMSHPRHGMRHPARKRLDRCSPPEALIQGLPRPPQHACGQALMAIRPSLNVASLLGGLYALSPV